MNGRSRFHPLSLLGALFIADWQQKLRVVLTGVILWQFVRWMDEYWLLNTEWIVRATIVVTAITELFPRIHPIIRRLATLVLITGVTMHKLGIWLPDLLLAGFGKKTILMFGQPLLEGLKASVPFIDFAIGTWIIYLVAIYWFKERSRLIIAIVLCVILFAFIDSYSKLVMWDRTAFIIFSGLGLVIIEHYERFRRKHPSSWEYLAEYPEKIATPIVIIIAFVMLAGIVAPNARPLLTDPYTLYKHWKGEMVITGGKGYSAPTLLQFSPLDSSSGYGRDDSHLGNGFVYDYAEVMRIQTTNKSYWRGETKAFYTGRGWESTVNESRAIEYPIGVDGLLPQFDWGIKQSGEVAEVKQTVKMAIDRGTHELPEYPVLFGAQPMSGLKLVEAEGDSNSAVMVQGNASSPLWSPQQGEIRWEDRDPYPLSYEIVSHMPVTDEVAWNSVHMEDYLDVGRGAIFADYLEVPRSLPQRVRDLATEITAEAATPYEKVKAIEAYLQSNYLYNNKPDLSKGSSSDFVDRFLFEMKEGYCDYYSTAMAVMVRTLDIPTRWVKGFKSGVNEMEEMYRERGGIPYDTIADLSSGGAGTFVVRNSDAHSWVEVFFPGYGWIPFEPTSGMVMPVVNGERERAALAPRELADLEMDDASDEFLALPWLSPAGAIALVASIAAAVVLWIGIRKYAWHRKLIAMRYRWRERQSRPLDQQALAEIGRVFRLLRRKGYTRSAHETARESFARWVGRNAYLRRDLDNLLSVLEKARYSPYGVTSDDMELILKTRLRLKEEL